MTSTVELATPGVLVKGLGDLIYKPADNLNGNARGLPLGRYTDYQYSDTIDGPEWWQIDDIENMTNHPFSANWSQMGCKKTSTGLWLIQRQLKAAREKGTLVGPEPSVLIITSRSGKGTFYQLAPHILQGFTFLSVQADGMYLFKDGEEIRIPKLDHCPPGFSFPAVVLIHYDLFSKANAGKFITDKESLEIVVDPESLEPIPLPWTQADYIIDRRWDFMWIDEAHKIKDKDGKRAVNIKKINTRFKTLSTGTGFINRPDEIWSLLNFLEKQRYGGYWSFRKAFCAEANYGGYTAIEGIKPEMVDPFRRIVRDVGPRRTLREVMPHLKEPMFVRREVDLSNEQRRMFNELKNELMALDKKGVPLHAPNVLACLQRMRQICVATPEVISDEYDAKQDRRVVRIKLTEPSSKLDAVMDLLEDSDEDDLFVVFSCFKDPLELLKKRLDPQMTKHSPPRIKRKGIPYIHMMDTDSDEERYDKWFKQFQTRQFKVFMSTLQLGGESINLTPANYLIFLDRSWSPKDNSQGIGRIDRPGQTKQPVIINIEAKRTTDQRVEAVNELKGSWFKQIFDPQEVA